MSSELSGSGKWSSCAFFVWGSAVLGFLVDFAPLEGGSLRLIAPIFVVYELLWARVTKISQMPKFRLQTLKKSQSSNLPSLRTMTR
jgi:hypothetical protein